MRITAVLAASLVGVVGATGVLMTAGCASPAVTVSASRLGPDVRFAALPRLETRPDGVRLCSLQTDYLFAFGSAGLTGQAEQLLGHCLEPVSAAAAAGRGVRVVGYADGVGVPDDNLQLSLARAHSVVRWLAAHGVPDSALAAEGVGERFAADGVADPAWRKVVLEIEP